MDFTNRDGRPAQAAGQTTSTTGAPIHNKGKSNKNFVGWRVASIALLFSATILAIALVLLLVLSPSESKNVKGKVQAVFLNGGQVYFGQITDINEKNLHLSNIYYLSVNQQVQPGQKDQTAQQNIQLVKLGCELHRPQDSMVINREQVIFWENLKDETAENTVPGAIKKYAAANPKQDCAPATTTNSTNTTTDTTNTSTKKP